MPTFARSTRTATILTALALLGLAVASIAGCGAKGTVVNPDGGIIAPFDGPSILRGTVGASASLIGVQPVLVSGLGIVVGTNDEGGPLPPGVEPTVIRQLSLREGSRGMDMFEGTPFEGESPESFLRRPDVSVVAVLGLIAPGAPQGSTFDLLVYSLNNEDLSGGHLWRTDLRLGRPTVQGGPATRLVGFAEGPVYVNPFAGGTSRANPTQGRIIGGGVMTNPLELAIRLNVPSPRRTRAIATMINTRFGSSSLDRGDIASGRLTGQGDASASLVTVSIPWSYKDRPEEFLRLVAHINPDAQSREELYVGRYIRALKEEPGYADRIAWALEALGPVAIKGGTSVSTLYDDPEIAPRMAALRVGARLGDPNAERPLINMARGDNIDQQIEAIKLLGELGTGAMIDSTLQDLAAADNISVRVAAYEALAHRAGLRELRRTLDAGQIPAGVDPTGVLREWREMAMKRFRGSFTEGVRRDVMPGGFIVDRVPIGKPLIFLRQQGQAGLVLFGPRMTIEPGAVLRVSDDFILARPNVGEDGYDPNGYDVRVRYRHQPADWLVTVPNAPADLHELIEFLSTRPTLDHPLAGLGMSFGKIVSVVSQLQQTEAVKAQWQVERNILRDSVDRQTRGAAADRPEVEGDRPASVDPLQDYIQRSISRPAMDEALEGAGEAMGETPVEEEG
ncbi:MAG: flagellar basal body P-ring protein FlgI [Phycisphaerales bacterium JB064]